ncbi:MAG: hypothetical protein LC800_14040 [Acidobacteria bacterium]|nr:hypothetical protein [Acidobacteriota bacterium]
MVKKRNAEPPDAAVEGREPAGRAEKHKAPAPDEAGAEQPARRRRSSSPGGRETYARQTSTEDIQFPVPDEGEYRDIGELSFGPPPEREAGAESAASAAQRRPVPDERVMPWSAICDLLIIARDNTLHTGTGWFISPTMLATAGHCVFVHAPGTAVHGFVKEIRVMPGRRGETQASQSLFGWAVAPENSFEAHDQWKQNGLRDFDYGVIALPASTPLGQRTGFFRYNDFQQLNGSAPILSGYPDSVPPDTVPEGTQWFEQNLIRNMTARRVSYDIFTVNGMSGSPVFFDITGVGFVACAIHNFGAQALNTGVRINQEVANQLDAWLGI